MPGSKEHIVKEKKFINHYKVFLDDNFIITDASTSLVEILEPGSKSLNDKLFLDYIVFEDRIILNERLNTGSERCEFRLIRADGRYLYADAIL